MIRIRIKGASRYVIICFVFAAALALSACHTPSGQDDAQTDHPVSSTPGQIPPPSVYASDKEGWLVNLDEAYAESFKTHKPILANFTGSDWCGWCKRLDQDVFSTPTFKAWAEKNVVLLEVDFPKRKQLPPKNKEQNEAMARSLNITGFPTIWILNITRQADQGRFKIDPVGSTGYAKTPEEFIGTLQQFLGR